MIKFLTLGILFYLAYRIFLPKQISGSNTNESPSGSNDIIDVEYEEIE